MVTAEMKREEKAGSRGKVAGAAEGLTEREMKLASKCEKCNFCNYARRKPETIVGRVMNWHGKSCPAWQALVKREKMENQDA